MRSVHSGMAPGWARGVLPLALLVLLLASCWAWRTAAGDLRPRLEPDTESYLKAPLEAGPRRVLSYYRTPGYPWFLRWERKLGPGFTPIPHLHALLFALGALTFYAGARRFTGRGWIALLVTVPLPFALITRYTASLLTEVPAAGLTLIATGCTLAVAADAPARLAWPVLVAAVAAANQIRPTTQWLVLWVPLGVAILTGLGGGRIRWLRVGGGAAAAGLPWLLVAALRLTLVGHFGLVSFAGTNLAGLATFLVDVESVAAMPRDVRPTAALILKRREQSGWPRLEFGDDARPWFKRYNRSLWKVGYRSANWHMHRELRRARGTPETELWHRPFPVERDRRLQLFSLYSIRGNPGGYVAWVSGAVRFGVSGMLRQPWVVFGILAVAASGTMRLVRRRGRPLRRRLLACAAACVLHCAGALLLISLFSFPTERYLAEVILLLPSGLLFLAGALAPAAKATTPTDPAAS